MPNGVFSILPENFFSPLATPNRQHYASLLLLYYRLFQENVYGLERELVVKEFTKYLTINCDNVADEADFISDEDDTESLITAEEASGVQEFNFDAEQETPVKKENTETGTSAITSGSEISRISNRDVANRFLKRLISTGWLSEETLTDFSRVINITAWGRPFFEALVRVDEGLKTEYESHVVNVYSSLCGETVKENGHFMVLKAREEARALIDSLKVLSQSIKSYYDKLNADAVSSKAASVLHEHYNLYAGEVLDRAYKRLKTSDNVSRYRQSIFKKITELLHDDKWLDASAGKYMRILSERTTAITRDECRTKLQSMLEEIRDDLKSVDPLEDDIDRRNADYSRSSTEKIRAYIEPDSTVAGKIGMIIKALYGGNKKLQSNIAHSIHRIQFLSPSSVALYRPREEGEFTTPVNKADMEVLDEVETEFFDRMKKRLSIKKIGEWLDDHGGKKRILLPKEIINDENSYIRFIYSLLYGDSRNDFGYLIEEKNDDTDTAAFNQNNSSVSVCGYIVPDVKFRRKNEPRP